MSKVRWKAVSGGMSTQGRRGWGVGGMGVGGGQHKTPAEGGRLLETAGALSDQRQAVGKSLASSNCTLVPSSVEMCHVTSSS